MNPESPWEMMRGESRQAYEGFIVYRDQGRDRSLVNAARALGKSTPVLEVWSRKWNWVERVRSWENHLQKVQDEAAQAELAEMSARHARIAAALVNKVVQRLVGDEANGVAAIDPNRLGWRDVDRVLDVAAKLERIARGLPANTVAATVTGADGAPLIPEQPEEPDADRIAAIVAALQSAGLVPGGSEPSADAEVDEVSSEGAES